MGGGYMPPHKRGGGGDGGSGSGGGGNNKGRNQKGGGGRGRPGSARGGGGRNVSVLTEAMRVKETAEKKASSGQPDVACERFEQAAVRSLTQSRPPLQNYFMPNNFYGRGAVFATPGDIVSNHTQCARCTGNYNKFQELLFVQRRRDFLFIVSRRDERA